MPYLPEEDEHIKVSSSTSKLSEEIICDESSMKKQASSITPIVAAPASLTNLPGFPFLENRSCSIFHHNYEADAMKTPSTVQQLWDRFACSMKRNQIESSLLRSSESSLRFPVLTQNYRTPQSELVIAEALRLAQNGPSRSISTSSFGSRSVNTQNKFSNREASPIFYPAHDASAALISAFIQRKGSTVGN
jgi:hypothetical protein